MPFDPNVPITNAELTSAMLRGQFQGLNSLIEAVPTVTSAVVDSVTTLDPGEAATVSASVVDGILHLTLGIPRGDMGAAGEQGPPFAQAAVDGVTTVNPTDPATVEVSFDGSTVHFTFAIPRGEDGAAGAAGEVTTAELEAAIGTAISGTSPNTNSIATLGSTLNDPPTAADYEALRAKLNEIILNGRRD